MLAEHDSSAAALADLALAFMHPLDDTIAAVASPPGGAARAIVRLSGPRMRDCLERMLPPRRPYVRLAVVRGPRPWPGCSGCRRRLAAAVRSLSVAAARGAIPAKPWPKSIRSARRRWWSCVLRASARRARLAEPGEFTLRAFLAGRIDLTQAEAVLGVIDAADAGELDVPWANWPAGWPARCTGCATAARSVGPPGGRLGFRR